MPALLRQPRKIKTRSKLQLLRAAKMLRSGGLLAHNTSTLPGIAANPVSGPGLKQMCRFKQRNGPFLLLAASTKAAMKICRRLSPELRQAMEQYWPGHTTLIVPARPGLPRPCYARGKIAVRVDASGKVRRLAKACGGLVVSSSLNRRGKSSMAPDRQLRMRFKRYVQMCITGDNPAGRPSTLLRFTNRRIRRLRS